MVTTVVFFLRHEMCTAEAALHIEGTSCPHGWPEHGEIEFQDYQMKYRDNTPVVLKGINLTIHGQEVVGVVGTTGSGELGVAGTLSSAPASGARTCFRVWVCSVTSRRFVGPHFVLGPVPDAGGQTAAALPSRVPVEGGERRPPRPPTRR